MEGAALFQDLVRATHRDPGIRMATGILGPRDHLPPGRRRRLMLHRWLQSHERMRQATAQLKPWFPPAREGRPIRGPPRLRRELDLRGLGLRPPAAVLLPFPRHLLVLREGRERMICNRRTMILGPPTRR